MIRLSMGTDMNEVASRNADPQRVSHDRHYLPGMGLNFLLPLYDPVTRLMGMQAVHHRLAEQAELDSAQRVLEIGCGTGNLTLLVKQRSPHLDVVGLDPDAKALARAARKARRAGLDLHLDRGFADELPYPDSSFDRVLSALVFHHLEATSRLATMREVLRVLRPGGSLHLVDFGGDNHHLKGLARIAPRSHKMDDNWADRIPMLMRDAGLSEPRQTAQQAKPIGPLAYYSATRTR